MSCEGVKTRPRRRVKAEYQFKFMGDISDGDGYWEELCNLSLKEDNKFKFQWGDISDDNGYWEEFNLLILAPHPDSLFVSSLPSPDHTFLLSSL